ncbi:MAG: GNAT family N-acetyltransferase [Planctomycetes bacterium]|nr:GNAT family N-acetyltransferase [Planctomycetota bacterium]
MTSDWSVRPYRPGDEHGILRLFNEVFTEADPLFRPRQLSHWNWQFRDNPLSHHTYVAEDGGGRVVGTYTAIPGTWLLDGAPLQGSQAVDTCVAREHRQSLKKEGLFLTLARRWFDDFGTPEKDRVVYGLPNPVAFRIGTRRLDYRPVHTPVRAFNRNFQQDWIDHLGRIGAGAVDVREVQTFAPAVHDLFEHHGARSGLVQRRDVRYLTWRYLECPTVRYRVLEARARDGELRGVLVLRIGWLGRPLAPLVDWIVPGEDREALAGLARAAAELARAAGVTCLETWVPPWSAHARTLQEIGFAADDSTFNLCIRVFGPSFDENWAKEHWFFTMGDSDIY